MACLDFRQRLTARIMWQGELEECSVCFDAIMPSASVITACQHVFCEGCLKDWMTGETADNAGFEKSCPGTTLLYIVLGCADVTL